MRVKLGAMIFGLFLVFGFLINFYALGNLESNSQSQLEQTLIHSYRVYQKAQRVSREERMDLVRSFAEEADIVAAMEMPSSTPEELDERHFKLFEKLEVLSRLKYPSDMFIVIDNEGLEQARTQVAVWKKNKFGDKQIVKSAISGKSGEDVWLIGGRIMIVDVAPINAAGKIIGAMIMGNMIDEDMVKTEKEIIMGDFAYFSENRVIASSLSSQKQLHLNRYVQQNTAKIAKVLLSKKDYFEDKVELGEETYIIVLSVVPTMEKSGLVGFMLLRSETNWLSEFTFSRNFLFIISILMVILGIALSLLIIQKLYDAIDFMLEGAHQIIMGNKEYEFNSDDDFINQLGQTLNLMIAILTGKYIPENEEEADQMAAKAGMGVPPKVATKQAAPAPAQAAAPAAEEEDFESADYFDKLFAEYIKAKESVGEDISQITKDRLIEKLQDTKAKLIEKHSCKSVKFTVNIEDGKVSLKPTPVWK